MPDSLFTFDYLSSLAGASFLTYLIVQYTKRYVDSFYKFSTDLYAVFVGFAVLLLTQLAQGNSWLDWKVYVLSFFNGFLIALASGKVNDMAFNPPAPKDYDVQ